MDITFEDWLAIGMANHWISPITCSMHDGIPTTDEEEDLLEKGEDPCCPVVRLWNDDERPSESWLSHWIYKI
jgi:hypothetical protein